MDSFCLFRPHAGKTRLLWEITNVCNLNCIHCYVKKDIRTELPLNFIKVIADRLSILGIDDVIISGGEPLLRKDIFEILSYIQHLGYSVDLCTNGILIDHHVARELSKFLNEISISLDGCDSSSYEMIRRKGNTFDKVINGIEMLRGYNTEIHIITVVTKYNYNKLHDIVKLAYELRSESITVLGLLSQENELKLSVEQWTIVREAIKDMRRQYNNNYKINTKRIFDNPPFKKCRAGIDVFGIDASGNLLPCILFKEMGLWQYDTLSTYNLSNDKLAKIRSEIKEYITRRCSFHKSCDKGCLGAYWTQNKKIGCDTFCVYKNHNE